MKYLYIFNCGSNIIPERDIECCPKCASKIIIDPYHATSFEENDSAGVLYVSPF